MKFCGKCQRAKSRKQFYRETKSKDGLGAWCKPCDNSARKARSAKKPWQHKTYSRRSKLKVNYGLTPEQFALMLEKQKSRCAVCTCKLIAGSVGIATINIDHCHITGKVRDLLCRRCNSGLGLFKDSMDLLLRAVEYLAKHKTKQNIER